MTPFNVCRLNWILSHQPPAGLLNSLPILHRSWSHIALNCITCLPPLEGHTTILTIFKRFSKAELFVLFSTLPSAAETGELLVSQVFQVLDWGPQCTSRVWQSLYMAIGASASLSSRYDPWSNGQAEHTNQTLENTLRCMTASRPIKWSFWLAVVEYAHN